MTFRARPRDPRPRATVDRGDRRNALLNVGFTIVVVASLLLLAVAAGLTWYNDHIAPAATVDGETISKDAAANQATIDQFRIELTERTIRTRLLAGTIRESDAEAQLAALSQQRANIAAIAVEHLIDGRIQARLATTEGITVTDDDVTAKLHEVATIPELRRAWLIEVEPETDENATDPTDAQKAAARKKAEDALKRLQDGADWETVAKDVSTSSTKDVGGDLGMIDAETSGLDKAWVDAVFAAPEDTPTAVIEGSDGIFRIGRVTEIRPAETDPLFEQRIVDRGVSVAAFRDALRLDVTRDKLQDLIVERVKQPGPQRQVLEIFLPHDDSESKTGALKTKHILYAPNDGEGVEDLPADDPAWKAAEQEARTAYEKLKADPKLWNEMAKEGDDGTASNGGKLPYFAPEDAEEGSLDKDFGAAIFKTGIEPGQILEPVKSAFGWHVIQIWHRPTDLDWAEKLKTDLEAGADFAQVARDNSEGTEAADGGDLGWVAKGQLPELLDVRVFGTPVGEISDPLLVPNTQVTAATAGVYLFKIVKEEVRTPEGEQLDELERTAFSTWYTEQKLKAKITRASDEEDALTQ